MGQHGVSIGGVGTSETDVQDMGPGAVTNQLPSLKATADMVRAQITSFNEYKNVPNQGYGPTHPNSQSDGDELGKGDGGNSTVGGTTDILTKDTLLYSSGNKYKPGAGYNNNNYAEQYW
jgi:hypothetical protein